MIKYILVVCFGLLLNTSVWAQVGQIPGWPPNANGTTGAAFVGVGDITAGSKGHYGSVAYKATTRGQNMYRICDASSSGTCKDIASDSTTGLVSSTQNVGSIGACGTGGNQCYIDKAYDDSGGLNCSGPAVCPVLFVGTARPKFVVNASGTLPGIGCNATDVLSNGAFTDFAQPFSFLASVSVTSDPGSYYYAIANGAAAGVGIRAGLLPYVFAGAVVDYGSAISSGVFYSLIGKDNNASSSIIVDGGTATTGTAGTNTPGTTINVCSGSDKYIILEAAIYPSDITADKVALSAAMHTNGSY